MHETKALILAQEIHRLVTSKQTKAAENTMMDYEGNHGADALHEALKVIPVSDLAFVSRGGDICSPSIVHLYIGQKQFAEMMEQELEYAIAVEDPHFDTASLSFVMNAILFRDDLRKDPETQMAFVSELAYRSHNGFAALVRYFGETLNVEGMDCDHLLSSVLDWYSDNPGETGYENIDDMSGNAIMHRMITYDEPLALDILGAMENAAQKTIADMFIVVTEEDDEDDEDRDTERAIVDDQPQQEEESMF
jgi:hypothetical protein